MKNNALQNPIPVRFCDQTKARVVRASKRFRLPASELIRRAVESQLEQWEQQPSILITSRK